jgi:hypothetical protein
LSSLTPFRWCTFSSGNRCAKDLFHDEDVLEDVRIGSGTGVIRDPEHHVPCFHPCSPALPSAVRASALWAALDARPRLLLLLPSTATGVPRPACRAVGVPARRLEDLSA